MAPHDLGHLDAVRRSGGWRIDDLGRFTEELRADGGRADHAERLHARVKSGAGLAPLPMLLGGSEDGLEPVLESIPEIDTKLYLVIQADLKRTPRVRVFCDFVVAELARLRPLITGTANERADLPAKEV
jgi:DNA-binding transcriptional LysR family regulator